VMLASSTASDAFSTFSEEVLQLVNTKPDNKVIEAKIKIDFFIFFIFSGELVFT